MAIGIIAEYNPFHNGHIYQLKKAKEIFPNEKIIIIMSGKYVQRGEIAICNFKKRKKMALKYGANEVHELPFEYATQAAHIFANGAIKFANYLGIKKIFFGSESDNPKELMMIAKTINENREDYNKEIKKNLKMGFSFPKSAANSLEALIGKKIEMPNDILGLEYCKSIVDNNFEIKPFTLKRTIDFHSEETNGSFASASFIRKLIIEKKDYSKYTPMKIKKFELIEDKYPDFQKIIKETSAEKLRNFKMISEGMENLFKKHIDAKNYHEFVSRTNSKRYTSSRIKRVMLYVLLKIKK